MIAVGISLTPAGSPQDPAGPMPEEGLEPRHADYDLRRELRLFAAVRRFPL